MFEGMSSAEFDAWLSALPSATYVAGSSDERVDRAELQAFRELRVLERELSRLETVQRIESTHNGELQDGMNRRRAAAEVEIDQLRKFLTSAGWDI
ncbi:hypothetical protein GCM10025881_15740 [Pseudolysinimonas kribbensis]|uniref:PH domain-containing protein n=3 Tax=Pseudolysinimonas kribbensis TaxID=433641 RepID=A0ABQ6K6Z6_9MICO|nr:hypothetical protein GCM10025881_15740 [Pseudolysinimonas kribbensis]